MYPLKKNKEINNPEGKLVFWLSVLLTLRIFSYFMLSDDVTIVQGFKIATRLSLTGLLGTIWFFQRLQSRKNTFTYTQPLPIVFYVLYLLLGLASLLWTSSVSASALQLTMDIETLAFAFFFLQIALQIPRERFFSVISSSILVTGVFFLAGMFINPDLFFRLTHGGEVSRLGGFIINPNELGMLLVFGTASLLPQLKENGKWRISKLLALLFLIVLTCLTQSRSAFLALFCIVSLYTFVETGKQLRLALIALLLLAIPTIGYTVFVKVGNVDEVLSMTGRIPFWKDLLTYNFPKAPLLGFGYMRIDYSDHFDSLNAYSGGMTHNTFLQVLLGLGLVGLLLILLQLATFFYALFSATGKVFRLSYICLIIPLLVNSMTEFGIFGETNFGILFYLLLVFSVATEPGSHALRTTRRPASYEPPPRLSVRPQFTA